jgi:putative transcriptional regulator
MTHPSPEHLLDYAAGSLPAGMSLLVACHLTYCPACRDRTARLEAVGGAFLRDEPPPGVRPPALARALSRLDAGPVAEDRAAPERHADEDDPVLPRPLRRIVGRRSDAIRWRFLLPGLSDHCLDGYGSEDVRLIRARPGTKILMHTHVGEEATLVLAGQIKDGSLTFARGEVSLAGPEDNHQPQIVGDCDCICLSVLSGPMRFTGRVGRLLNYLTH